MSGEFPISPIPERNPNTNGYLDNIDVIRSYDDAIINILKIPIPGISVFPRPVLEEELSELPMERLRLLARKLRVVNPETDRKDLLIRGILNIQFIPVVFATPSVAYATQEITTGKKEGSPVFTVRYPIISIQRTDIADDPVRFSLRPRRHLGLSDDGNQILGSWQPNPVNFIYQIEFLSQHQSIMNLMDLWINRLWSFPVVQMKVDHGKPFGVKVVHAFKEASYQDNTVYEFDAEQAEKMVRHVYTVRIEGWIPTESWLTPTVRAIRYNYILDKKHGDVISQEDIVESQKFILEQE